MQSRAVNKELIEEVKKLLAKNMGIMIEFFNGRVYYLPQHWKHLSMANAQRIYMCEGIPPKGLRMLQNKYFYIHCEDQIKQLANESNTQRPIVSKRRNTFCY